MKINDPINIYKKTHGFDQTDMGVRYHAKSGYIGNVAADYNRKRQTRKKWKLEIAAMAKIVSQLAENSQILDLPLGTGRFIPIYQESGHRVLGIDISLDMLQQAREKAGEIGMTTADFAMGDAEAIPLADNAVDYVACIRLLNWVTHPVMTKVIQEFQRVARKGIIIGFRTSQTITFREYLSLGLRDLVPTLAHVRKWLIGVHRFANKVRGKVVSMVFPVNPNSAPAQKVQTGSTYYDRAEMFALFQRLHMTLLAECPIDKTATYSKGVVKPYAIYYLRLDK